MKLVSLVSLGCPKNLVDSEEALGLLGKAGYLITDALEEAEVIIVNTCSFIAPAVTESYTQISECIEMKKNGSCRCLVVMGCLPQRYRDELAVAIPNVDIWLGVNAASTLLNALQMFFQGEVADNAKSFSLSTSNENPRLLSTPKGWAYLKIAEGCSHACAYCLIPQIRGRLRSKTPQAIIKEARQLAAGGVREVILVAQDTGSYGRDLPDRTTLAALLRKLSSIPELRWIRVLYLCPDSISRELIETIASGPKICHYLDIPFQHADRSILKLMRRVGDTDSHLRLIENLRRLMPDLVLRTTLITGFPGEDLRTYQKLQDFIELAEFDRLGVFPYYHEEGAPSYRLPDTVHFLEKRRRCREIMQLQREISRAKNRELTGRSLLVLLEESLGDQVYLGRSYRDAPNVDPRIIISGAGEQLEPGCFIKVRITSAYAYDLAGRAVSKVKGTF
jgi:ribosomal protein S12 methylthiotransferase